MLDHQFGRVWNHIVSQAWCPPNFRVRVCAVRSGRLSVVSDLAVHRESCMAARGSGNIDVEVYVSNGVTARCSMKFKALEQSEVPLLEGCMRPFPEVWEILVKTHEDFIPLNTLPVRFLSTQVH